jgi:hypothetical protein
MNQNDKSRSALRLDTYRRLICCELKSGTDYLCHIYYSMANNAFSQLTVFHLPNVLHIMISTLPSESVGVLALFKTSQEEITIYLRRAGFCGEVTITIMLQYLIVHLSSWVAMVGPKYSSRLLWPAAVLLLRPSSSVTEDQQRNCIRCADGMRVPLAAESVGSSSLDPMPNEGIGRPDEILDGQVSESRKLENLHVRMTVDILLDTCK